MMIIVAYFKAHNNDFIFNIRYSKQLREHMLGTARYACCMPVGDCLSHEVKSRLNDLYGEDDASK